ncbi:MAG TPA: TM2 domain-containing protein [Bacillales bacterium]|nr:TM2 domain-containing protein [Bacillales bacterium]
MSNAGLRNSLSDRDLMLVNTEFERKKKSRVIAFILWFFLGALGAHRFYTGQIGYAVCILLLGWLTFGIWPFIDGLVLLISGIDKINDEIEKEIIYAHK